MNIIQLNILGYSLNQPFMIHKTLGVIGGLGVQTSQLFCTNVVKKVRDTTKIQPSILCHTVNLSLVLESDLVYSRPSKEHLSVLLDSIKLLESAGVSKIAIPCNTVHIFIEEMRASSKVPILSIIDETAQRMAAEGFGKVGLLASSTSINAGLYQRELSKHRIGALVPTKDEQKMISDLIFKILNGTNFSADLTRVIQVIENLENHGAEAFILGCTDLRLINLPSNVPMIDSTSVLEDVAIRYLVDLN